MTNEELVMCIQKGERRKENLEQLYLQNKGFVANVAKRYCGYADMDDLMQEGFIGLCAACEDWDKCKGANFLSYAFHHIRQTIHRYVQEQKSSIRIPEFQLGMVKKYEKLVNESIQNTSKTPSDRFLMLRLGISMEQLKQIKIDAKKANIKSLDATLSIDDELVSLGDCIADPDDHITELEETIQSEQLEKELWEIVGGLDPEQSVVIHERYKNNLTLKDTAVKLNTTTGRVKTCENKAMRELRKQKNIKRLESYYTRDSYLFSISLSSSGLQTFLNTWTSAPEKAVLLAEQSR